MVTAGQGPTYPGDAPASAALFARARAVTPGGVNSPVRAFRAVGGTPRFMARGHGPYLADVDGREYVDLVGSWGPMILGHAHPAVRRGGARGGGAAASRSARPAENEVLLAEEIVARVAPVEQVRLVSSRHRGDDERDPAGPRVHRPRPGREVRRALPRPRRRAAGQRRLRGRHPRPARHPRRHRRGRRRHDRAARTTTSTPSRPPSPSTASEIACLITEAAAGNMGVVPPDPGFTEALRRVTAEHGALLISDEVMTGFRVVRRRLVRPRGRRRPDLITFGKVMGGGFPAAAFGGRADVMALLAPAGPVYQAGTLSGNPVATAAGPRHAAAPATTPSTPASTRPPRAVADAASERPRRRPACRTVVQSRRAPCSASSSSTAPVRDYDDARGRTPPLLGRSSTRCSTPGVYLPPSAFESWFVSAAHDDAALERVARRAARRGRARPPRPHRGDRRACPAGEPTTHRGAPAAPRRGAQPRAGPLRPAAGLPPVRARPADGRPGRRVPRRPRHHPRRLLAAGARPGDRGADRRRARPRRSPSTSG